MKDVKTDNDNRTMGGPVKLIGMFEETKMVEGKYYFTTIKKNRT